MINFVRELGRAFFLGVLIFILIWLINFMNGHSMAFNQSFITRFLINQVYTITLYFAHATFIRYFIKKYGRKIFSASILPIFLFASILITLFLTFFLNGFGLMVRYGISLEEAFSEQRPADFIATLVITVIISLSFVAFYYYKNKQETKFKEQKVIAGRATAQFESLKNQLDPHFLFNSLNVLTSLIDENPSAAQKFTTSLSKVYRYVLEQKNKELITVKEEIEFAKTYISLLRMRFEDSIVFDITDDLLENEAKVVPLSLQLLLENAVKHNRVSPQQPLKISIEAKDNYLIVKNNLQQKSVLKKSSGVGLINIKQRYHLLTSREVIIEKNTQTFQVKIPILTKQISTMTTQENYIQDKRYKRAKERVDAIKGFYGNLTAYLIVIPCLAWLNYKTTDFPWVIFPTLGWGIGLLTHGMQAYGYNPLWGKDWEERKIKEYMEKDI
ncbi:2TM domain-containing protein [Galbibacter mesophilus]|uniref:2TM domain-containing protein n=1 Tax=Galbibacter mesophilus TaxID=379069 RepID=UPI00191E2962|nr:2TM domain-containing protein [Galbibacter mesophilus]MCM5663669.1 2TM domain-containing protein [Galbibacter mesophilus]